VLSLSNAWLARAGLKAAIVYVASPRPGVLVILPSTDGAVS